MKPLINEIQDILTPNQGFGLVKDQKIFQLQPIMPISQLMELADDLDRKGQQKILDLVNKEDSVIYNGILYFTTKGLNLSGRLKEILAVYNAHMKEIVGNKKALIDLYEKIPAEDIANLTEDHVIFALKKPINSNNKVLAAIRYMPSYEIHFEKKTYRMPGCIIAVHIDNELRLGNPEIIYHNTEYEHPFVYRGASILGQKMCMGSFYNSKDQKQFNVLRFANNLNNLIKQSVQILVSGYNRSVTPANRHLTHPIYSKYIVKDEIVNSK